VENKTCDQLQSRIKKLNQSKTTIMSTLARLIAAAIVAIWMTSCNFDITFNTGLEGNGNVITEKRQISDNFDAIAVSRGLEVYLTQGDDVSLTVEADENLHDIIITEVVNGVLEISADDNIKSAKAKKIILTAKTVNNIDTSSGAYIHSENTLTTNTLSLESSSGSHMDLVVAVNTLDCDTASGAGLKIAGTTENLKAEASSGSYIKASQLEASVSRVSASSGANVSVNTSKELSAEASSGGNITYAGNPEKVNKNKGVSGSINRQ